MILVDANLLIYSKMSRMRQHPVAYGWLEEKLRGPSRVGMPWSSLLAFVRVVTHPRFAAGPLSLAQAWEQVETWLACPAVWIPGPTDQHRAVLGSLWPYVGSGGNLVGDAHLAAMAIEHGLTVCTADGDFARFPGLRCFNPLLAG